MQPCNLVKFIIFLVQLVASVADFVKDPWRDKVNLKIQNIVHQIYMWHKFECHGRARLCAAAAAQEESCGFKSQVFFSACSLSGFLPQVSRRLIDSCDACRELVFVFQIALWWTVTRPGWAQIFAHRLTPPTLKRIQQVKMMNRLN